MDREERLKKYGSIIYCPQEDILCWGVTEEDGSCRYEKCPIHDPEYIAKCERQRKNYQSCHEKYLEEIEEDRRCRNDS